jgi:hypothetical protein
MTFELPDLTLLAVISVAAAVLAAGLLLGALVAFFVANRKVRVARREPVLGYYRRGLLGH